jgi:hypothetical protein
MHQSSDETVPWKNHHLRTRCQQRGVIQRELQALLDAADRLVPVGSSCVSMTVSRSAIAALRAEGRAEGTAVAYLDRVGKRAAVTDVDGVPITVLIPSRRKGRRYRHGRIGRTWARH